MLEKVKQTINTKKAQIGRQRPWSFTAKAENIIIDYAAHVYTCNYIPQMGSLHSNCYVSFHSQEALFHHK